jgi:hypothetical protein
MTNEQLITHYDYQKIEKLSKKVDRIKNSKTLHESYLYNIDEYVAETDEIIKKICHILVKELISLIKTSPFFKDSTPKEAYKDARTVFMILKSFKQLVHSEEYVYRTINNEIIDPEFNKFVQLALKSKSLATLTSFSPSNLPLHIFTSGVLSMLTSGPLTHLIKMCHSLPTKKPLPLHPQIHISGYNILSHCILSPISALLSSKLSFTTSPGIPKIFLWSYKAVAELVQSVQSMGGKEEGILVKFNLGIYSTMIQRELVTGYTEGVGEVFKKGKLEGLWEVVIEGVRRWIAEDIFLAEIGEALLGVAVRMVIKVLQEVKEVISKKSMSAENLLRVLDEVTKIEQYLNYKFLNELTERVSEWVGIGREEVMGQLSEAFHELNHWLGARFDALNHPWISAASEKITQRLAENMRQFKQIAGIYRLTNKKAPKTHTEYTNVTYKPVEILVSKEFFIHLNPKLKTLLLDSIFQKSLTKLHSVVQEMLEEEKNKSNSLSKFSKEGTKQTDYDNICIQIYLDVKELENTIDKLGGSREYQEIQDLYNLISSYMSPGWVGMYQ